jgi:hypothetical protein
MSKKRPNWKCISGGKEAAEHKIDFATASEEELLNAEYEDQALREYLVGECKLEVHPQTGRKKMVNKLMDYRFRQPNASDTDPANRLM